MNNLKIFLLVGQSNMAGRGRPGDAPAIRDERIRMFRDGQWRVAEEPIHTDKPEVAGIGLAMSFALGVLDRDREAPVGFVPGAVGGSSLDQWTPGKDLFENAVADALDAMRGGCLAGILWHQGEADSGDPEKAGSYTARFSAMTRELRSRLGAEQVPIIAGELGPFLQYHAPCVHFKTVNRQLREACECIPGYRCVSAEGLSDNGDHIHFDAKSLRAFGSRYAKAYLAIERGFKTEDAMDSGNFI